MTGRWTPTTIARLAALVVVATVLAAPASAQPSGKSAAPKKGEKAAPSDNYDELFQRYLLAARATASAPTAPGDLWMAGLMGDFRARKVNDLVTVNVVENITALGSADSNLDKKSNASASVANLFGVESKLPGWIDPASLASLGSNTSFKGGGSTTRSGSLSAAMTTRVVEVLPNGDLALEGVREVEINGDRQMLVLTGVARVRDISPGNVVPSTAIGQMRIRYFGRGLIKDNLSPGILVRVLNKIF
jgi:flagellar L-ring protein precursor FlgH